MAKSGAYEETKGNNSENSEEAANADSDIEVSYFFFKVVVA